MKKTEVNYPAAHSMDTTWYGVDEAGNVAAFSTGSEGSLPKDAMGSEEDVNLESEIRKMAARGEATLHLDELFNEPFEPLDSLKAVKPYSSYAENLFTADFWKRFFRPKRKWWIRQCLILFHPNLNISQQPWKPSSILSHYNGLLAEFDHESVGPVVAEYKQLLKEGMVLRVWANRTLSERDVGLYQYYCGNDSESETFALPRDQYGRYFVPKHPIHVDQLPAHLRDAVLKAKMPLEFAAAETIEIGRHFKDLITYDLGNEPEEEPT